MKATLVALLLAACAAGPAPPQTAESHNRADQLLIQKIAGACEAKYGKQTNEALNCILRSKERNNRDDRSPDVVGPSVTCTQMGDAIACN